jgi:RNA polymerase sigma-70 factor (ECF subfamily)
MRETSDGELLDRWRLGDSRSGEQLTARHFMTVRAYFLNKAPSEYEDLVQETFLRVSSKRDNYRGTSSFRAFLLGIARMILLEFLRAKQRAQRFDPLEHSVADVEGGRMSSALARDESHRLLLAALRELPLAEQELLELYYWQRLTAREIGELQATPESTVRSRVRAALDRANRVYAQLERQPERDAAKLEGWLDELGRELMGIGA